MENGKQLIHSFNSNNYSEGYFQDLTKREYFAGLAMQGMIANSHPELIQYNEAKTAKWAISVADELLKQLNDEQ